MKSSMSAGLCRSSTLDGSTLQMVAFRLEGEHYAVPIQRVREIQELGDTVPIPRAPEYVRGLMTLRDTVIPVLDLRARLGLPSAPPDAETKTIVLRVDDQMVGIVVDAVEHVLRTPVDQINDVPATVEQRQNEYLKGLVRIDGKLILLLDVDRVVGPCDAEALLADVAAS